MSRDRDQNVEMIILEVIVPMFFLPQKPTANDFASRHLSQLTDPYIGSVVSIYTLLNQLLYATHVDCPISEHRV